MKDAKDIEAATTTIQSTQSPRPDSKARRYDRQLRLWASSGQSALESARVLLLSGSATSTSTLKNLVLPGVGHFTILDSEEVCAADAGNNFFLEGPDSIGKNRAEEAVKLLKELNESVEGVADTRSLAYVIEHDKAFLASFDLIISHNTDASLLERLANFLWDESPHTRLIVVRSAGFLAEICIQLHEHTITDSHPETPPSLRIDKPFDSLLDLARSLDFDTMDSVEHGHVTYVVILVRVMDDWKKAHGGDPPKTSKERQEFKDQIANMKKKFDEENFDEAVAQAYRAWTETKVPFEIQQLFDDPCLTSLSPSSPPFFHLLNALREFTKLPPYTLPLSSTLPDMKSDTTSYIHLQKLYKAQAEREKDIFKKLLSDLSPTVTFDRAMVDDFLKNSHGLKIIRGSKWGTFDKNYDAVRNALSSSPHETCIHLALSALSLCLSKDVSTPPELQRLREAISIITQSELPSEIDEALGEVARTPTADLPNMAAFLGGIVAQEAIKVITKQYVPLKGLCIIDLIASTTGVIDV